MRKKKLGILGQLVNLVKQLVHVVGERVGLKEKYLLNRIIKILRLNI
ncbi:MAG: hypothetical protein P8Y70_04850 [Candidatus Lokiarchaeota archaeon]